LLAWMRKTGADYTNSFLVVADVARAPDHFRMDDAFRSWHQRWVERIDEQHGGLASARTRMWRVNPCYIPRNHLVEEALVAASADGDYSKFHALLMRQQNPYQKSWKAADFDQVPGGFDIRYKTFCGT
jgi:serine/tyrosine/threonine adenylyltransferase